MHKAKASQIHAASSDAAIGGAKYEPGFDDDGNEADPESRKMTARKTPVGMISPSISFNGATTISRLPLKWSVPLLTARWEVEETNPLAHR